MVTRANVTTVPAPSGGLNVFDNYMDMPPIDALKLVNFVPSPYGCRVRRGYKYHVSELGGTVNSLVPHANIDGSFKLFAFADGKMFDVTDASNASEELSALVSDVWQYASVANSAGTHTVMFSGEDDPVWYHDGVIKRLVAGSGTDDATWANIDPEKLAQGVVHQRRLWAVERDSTNAWYLAADSFYGAASFFDFGPFFKRGGYLAMLGTWSADVGEGSDDHLVAVSSEGEAAVFAGLDPDDPSAWQLRGVFYVGTPPSGRRFMTNVGGDLLILTAVGVVSMGTILMSNTVAATADTAYSKKIQHLLNREISDKHALPGWEIHFYPKASLLTINIPSVYDTGETQLVANYLNQSWCTFSALPARCWVTVADKQFFGADEGTVFESWVGHTDAADYEGAGGLPITAECQQAYNYFGMLGSQKQIGMYKPTFIAEQRPGYTSHVIYDFKDVLQLSPSTGIQAPVGGIWDTDRWGEGMWRGGAKTFATWRAAAGIGTAASLHMAVACERETTWVGTDFTLKGGGPL